MTSVFPNAIQDFDLTRGTSGDSLGEDGKNHITHHQNEDDTLGALQVKVGINNSQDKNSFDYKLNRGGQSISIPNGANHSGISITNNETTNNNNSMEIVNATIGKGLFIDQNGNGVGLHIDNDGTSHCAIFDGGNVGVGTTSPTSKLAVVSDGTAGLVGLSIDPAQDARGLAIIDSGNRTVELVHFRNQGSSSTGQVINARNDGLGIGVALYNLNVSSTNNAMLIQNDGTGKGLFIDQNGNGTGLYIDNDGTSHCAIFDGGNVGINTSSPTAKLDVNSDIIRLRTSKTPASATASGNQGDIAWDNNYLYVCVATNTWKRMALSTW